MDIYNLSARTISQFSAYLQATTDQYQVLTTDNDSLSRVVAEPHPTHIGLNIFARDKNGNVVARLCAIDAGLTLFDDSNNVVWAK